MKSAAQLLVEALDRVSAKDPKAATKIFELKTSTESKLAACTALLEGKPAEPKWRAGIADALVTEIRESCAAFRLPVKPTPKHNGVLENSYPGHASAGTGDADSKQLLCEAAQRAFGLTKKEAQIFAEIDGPSFTELIMKEGGGQ